MSAHPSVRPSACPSLRSLVRPSVRPSNQCFVRLSAHPSVRKLLRRSVQLPVRRSSDRPLVLPLVRRQSTCSFVRWSVRSSIRPLNSRYVARLSVPPSFHLSVPPSFRSSHPSPSRPSIPRHDASLPVYDQLWLNGTTRRRRGRIHTGASRPADRPTDQAYIHLAEHLTAGRRHDVRASTTWTPGGEDASDRSKKHQRERGRSESSDTLGLSWADLDRSRRFIASRVRTQLGQQPERGRTGVINPSRPSGR